MRNFLAKLFTFAVTKGLVIFALALGLAQIAKSALIEAKYGNYTPVLVWTLLIASWTLPIIIIKKIKK